MVPYLDWLGLYDCLVESNRGDSLASVRSISNLPGLIRAGDGRIKINLKGSFGGITLNTLIFDGALNAV
jgi:hypothetical protein